MSTRPSAPTQLQLPLVRVTPDPPRPRSRRPSAGRGRAPARVQRPASVPPPRTTGDDQGRLDEQTRQIGRRGIAAARARLAATGQHPTDRPGRVQATDPVQREAAPPEDRSQSGHAA